MSAVSGRRLYKKEVQSSIDEPQSVFRATWRRGAAVELMKTETKPDDSPDCRLPLILKDSKSVT